MEKYVGTGVGCHVGLVNKGIGKLFFEAGMLFSIQMGGGVETSTSKRNKRNWPSIASLLAEGVLDF